MKYYLQKIYVVLHHKECEKNAVQMKARVENQGILVELLTAPEMIKDSVSESLYISDNSDWLHGYKMKDLPVLAYYHDYNKEEIFSGISYGCEMLEQLEADYFDRIYRRCKGISWEILETDRCLLRETSIEDVDDFYKIYKEPSITRYMENLFPNREQEIEYIRDYIKNVYEFYDFGVWTVVRKETGEIIGRAGLSYREGCETPEIGFVIGVPWQKSGIAEEVCRAILNYGKEMLGFEEVQALVDEENIPSCKLCSKLGFENVEMVELDGKQMLRMLKHLQ